MGQERLPLDKNWSGFVHGANSVGLWALPEIGDKVHLRQVASGFVVCVTDMDGVVYHGEVVAGPHHPDESRIHAPGEKITFTLMDIFGIVKQGGDS